MSILAKINNAQHTLGLSIMAKSSAEAAKTKNVNKIIGNEGDRCQLTSSQYQRSQTNYKQNTFSFARLRVAAMAIVAQNPRYCRRGKDCLTYTTSHITAISTTMTLMTSEAKKSPHTRRTMIMTPHMYVWSFSARLCLTGLCLFSESIF